MPRLRGGAGDDRAVPPARARRGTVAGKRPSRAVGCRARRRRDAVISLFDADPKTYVPHRLHGDDRSFIETNCYADVVIELLHASNRDPVAVLGGAVAVDFEGDQWTFFKPSSHELEELHGVDIHEMQPYRELPVQLAEQLQNGRTM